jgi:hypothetical protein
VLIVKKTKKTRLLGIHKKEMVVQLRVWSVPCQDKDFLIGSSDSDDVIDVDKGLVYGQTQEK